MAQVPVYDFVTSRRSLHQVRTVAPCDVIILEGILVSRLPKSRYPTFEVFGSKNLLQVQILEPETSDIGCLNPLAVWR